MDWIVLSFHQNFDKRQFQLNRIVFCSKFSISTIWFDWYIIFIKYFKKDYMDRTAIYFHQNFLKRQNGVNSIVFWPKYSQKTTWVEPYSLLIKIFGKVFLKMGWTILSFWTKFSKKTIWVEPYSLLIKIFKKTICIEQHNRLVKTLLKDNVGSTLLSFSQNFCIIDYMGWTILCLVQSNFFFNQFFPVKFVFTTTRKYN